MSRYARVPSAPEEPIYPSLNAHQVQQAIPVAIPVQVAQPQVASVPVAQVIQLAPVVAQPVAQPAPFPVAQPAPSPVAAQAAVLSIAQRGRVTVIPDPPTAFQFKRIINNKKVTFDRPRYISEAWRFSRMNCCRIFCMSSIFLFFYITSMVLAYFASGVFLQYYNDWNSSPVFVDPGFEYSDPDFIVDSDTFEIEPPEAWEDSVENNVETTIPDADAVEVSEDMPDDMYQEPEDIDSGIPELTESDLMFDAWDSAYFGDYFDDTWFQQFTLDVDEDQVRLMEYASRGITIFVSMPLTAGVFMAITKALRTQSYLNPFDMLRVFRVCYYLRIVCLAILLTIMMTIAYSFFIIPGIYLSFATTFTLLIHSEHPHLGACRSIIFSGRVARKYCCSMMFFIFITWLISMSGLFAVFVGAMFTVPLGMVALVFCYNHIVGLNGLPISVPADLALNPEAHALEFSA